MKQARFHFERDTDATGVSGTGRVADGVMFSDGTCAVRWLSEHRSTAIYASIADVVAIHGHGGQTRVVFDDCPGCEHDWRHHWMDNCGACDVSGCHCTAMATLPVGCMGASPVPPPNCLCTPAL